MILAADFGGTTIKLGLVRDSVVVARHRIPTDAKRPMTEQLETVARAWEQLLAGQRFKLSDCVGTALALPFLIDPKSPRVFGEFGKFPGATEVDFSEWSCRRLALPVVLENDLRLALLGECAAGVARGKNDAVMLAFGTGIGCAVLSGGKLLRGANNRAATLFGHSALALIGSPGRCGNVGCAEDMASTATLVQLAAARPDFADSKLSRAKVIDYETVFRLSAQDDACSRALVHESLRVWATVTLNAVLAFDPEIVVLGGGVLRSREVVLPAIRDHLRQHTPGLPLETPVVAAELGDDAALLGGEVFFRQQHGIHPE